MSEMSQALGAAIATVEAESTEPLEPTANSQALSTRSRSQNSNVKHARRQVKQGITAGADSTDAATRDRQSASIESDNASSVPVQRQRGEDVGSFSVHPNITSRAQHPGKVVGMRTNRHPSAVSSSAGNITFEGSSTGAGCAENLGDIPALGRGGPERSVDAEEAIGAGTNSVCREQEPGCQASGSRFMGTHTWESFGQNLASENGSRGPHDADVIIENAAGVFDPNDASLKPFVKLGFGYRPSSFQSSDQFNVQNRIEVYLC